MIPKLRCLVGQSRRVQMNIASQAESLEVYNRLPLGAILSTYNFSPFHRHGDLRAATLKSAKQGPRVSCLLPLNKALFDPVANLATCRQVCCLPQQRMHNWHLVWLAEGSAQCLLGSAYVRHIWLDRLHDLVGGTALWCVAGAPGSCTWTVGVTAFTTGPAMSPAVFAAVFT